MRRRALFWKIFPIYFLITLLSVLAVSWFALNSLKEFYYSQVESDLEARARTIALWVSSGDISPSRIAGLEKLTRSIDESTGARITVIANDGLVLADSEHDPSTMANHSDRPEFQQALGGGVGRSQRPSPTLGIAMVYVAVPVMKDGRTTAVVRTSLAASGIDSRPSALSRHVLLLTLLVAMVAGLASLLVSRRIAAPISAIRSAAGRLAEGDLTHRIHPADTTEIAGLAETLNTMAAQLDKQLTSLTEQSAQQKAILSSMTEAVIAIGSDERIIILNKAAGEMLSVDPDVAAGKTIQEAIRNPAIQKFLRRCWDESCPDVEEMTLHGQQERTVKAAGTSLVDAKGTVVGVLAVLDDITQSRRLENMRKDFVANVSHELKTPITAIQGSIETLRLSMMPNQAKSEELLDILQRNSGRLSSIVDDLLVLSSVEQQSETSQIRMELCGVSGVIKSAVDACSAHAAAASVEISVEPGDSLQTLMNAALIEQAVMNLLDNAIKAAPGGHIRVVVEPVEGEIAIRVTDDGPGISPEHLPRLFERFYRVDKARSRKQGGTGLGLAIVKHIVQAHGGRVDVRSEPGKGSTFSLFLPARPSS